MWWLKLVYGYPQTLIKGIFPLEKEPEPLSLDRVFVLYFITRYIIKLFKFKNLYGYKSMKLWVVFGTVEVLCTGFLN